MRAEYIKRPLTRFGGTVAILACAVDQASKLYLLFVFQLAENGPISLGPFFDLVFTRNRGVSYGLLETESELARWLLLAFQILAIVLLWIWLTRSQNRLAAAALGLIIGGAIGNVIDRLAYGWVADFVFFHISAATWQFNWYVFNLADVTIVAGVLGLLYESFGKGQAAKGP